MEVEGQTQSHVVRKPLSGSCKHTLHFKYGTNVNDHLHAPCMRHAPCLTWRAIIVEPRNAIVNLKGRDVEQSLLQHIRKDCAELLPGLRTRFTSRDFLILLNGGGNMITI